MLHLGSIRGTSIDVDLNFIFLLLFFVVMRYDERLGIHYALLWIPILFMSVLVHELAHAAMIAILGFGSSHVILTGMGGVTVNARRARPWQNLLISLAGPVSSFALAFLCAWLFGMFEVMRTDRMLVALIPNLVAANIWWGLFNLIPLPPLDGGHALRDLCRLFLSEIRSFVVAIWVGMIAGVALVVYFAIGREYLVAVFIAFFLYMAFQQWQHFKQTGVPGD
jgi:stage IV sporulation protein FB